MDILYAGKKYMLPRLSGLCAEYVNKNITSDNAIIFLKNATSIDEGILNVFCLNYIAKNTDRIIKSDAFKELDQDTLRLIINSDTLGSSEITIFDACIAWGESQCRRKELEVTGPNLREVLGPVLWGIRFPLISLGDFVNRVSKRRILTSDEAIILVEWLAGDSHNKPKPEDIPFLTDARFAGWQEQLLPINMISRQSVSNVNEVTQKLLSKKEQRILINNSQKEFAALYFLVNEKEKLSDVMVTTYRRGLHVQSKLQLDIVAPERWMFPYYSPPLKLLRGKYTGNSSWSSCSQMIIEYLIDNESNNNERIVTVCSGPYSWKSCSISTSNWLNFVGFRMR